MRAAGPTEAPLVLCLHGFPDDASTFDGLLTALAAAGLRGVAPYCRGYAPSPLRNPDGSRFGRDLMAVLADDALAVAEALAPGAPFSVVGHDNGAFSAYSLLARAPAGRVRRAVTLTAGHPAQVFANTARSPRQLWRSRYAIWFQVPGAGWYVRRRHFAYVEKLWRRWAAPGWAPPGGHLATVKKTLGASWPAPLQHYRSGGINGGQNWPLIATPTLYLAGALDGCVLPETAAGQERYFSGPFRSEVVPGAGHFLHLEQPEAVQGKIMDWLSL